METIQMSIVRWMGKEHMAYIHTMKYYFAFKKGNSDICDSGDTTGGHDAKLNEPVH